MKKYIYLTLVAAFTLNSCLKDDSPSFYFVPISVKSVEMPDSFIKNETYEIKVTFNKASTCTNFNNFEVSSSSETTRKVVVVGTKLSDTENCDQALVEETKSFNFKVLFSEKYTFNFWTGENSDGEQEYLKIEVPVEKSDDTN